MLARVLAKQDLGFSLTYFLILLQLSCFPRLDVKSLRRSASHKNEVNEFIYGLNYNRDEVLSYKGESVKGVKTQGVLDHNKFIVYDRERKSMYNSKADLGVLTSNEHRTYPGSLLLANHFLMDNVPDLVAVQRAPLKYTVNLPCLTSDGSFKIIPTFADYEASINRVLNSWFQNYAKDHDVNTLFQSDYSFVYSKEQLRVKFGMAFKNTDVELNIDFSAVNKQEKLIMIQRFQQIFYTVSVEYPCTPAELFGDEVTCGQLARRINNQNPPVMVDSVSYGRVIYVKIETTSTDQEAKNIMETKLTQLDGSGDAEMDYSQHLKNFNMHVYVMGGGSEHIDLVDAKTMKEVNDVIIKCGKFAENNLGYPISYATEFIKDNSRAVFNSMTEYTDTTKTVYNKGIIRLEQYGGYVAQWKVAWDEISYDENGNKVTKRVKWGKNWDDITSPFVTEIELAGNCENITVFARECTGLFWEWWRTVMEHNGIPLINYRAFKISGTTLSPSAYINPPL